MKFTKNLMNFQSWHVGQKIISRKKAHEDKVINYTLKIKLKVLGWVVNFQIKLQVFPQNPNMKKLQLEEQKR